MGAFDLWDTESGNRIGTYRSERAALLDVADAIRRYGEDAPVVRALGLAGPDDRALEGGALIQRARAVMTQRPRPHQNKHAAA